MSKQVKDESIVRLTNQLHEMELKNVMSLGMSVPPPSPGGPRLPAINNVSAFTLSAVNNKMAVHRTNSNGISFDSDKGEFKEFVDVGVQTSDKTNTVSHFNNKSSLKSFFI
jgi:hypothetical protein